MSDFDLFGDDDRTPEERAEDERIEAANRELWQRRIDDGWLEERDGTLRHPTDFDVWMQVDPFSQTLILSEKLNQILQGGQDGSQVA